MQVNLSGNAGIQSAQSSNIKATESVETSDKIALTAEDDTVTLSQEALDAAETDGNGSGTEPLGNGSGTEPLGNGSGTEPVDDAKGNGSGTEPSADTQGNGSGTEPEGSI